MEELFRSWLYSLLSCGCICSLLLFINSEGKMKSLLETACTTIMVLTFVTPFDGISSVNEMNDYFQKWTTVESFAFDHQAYNKSFMEAEYSTYIRNEANAFGLVLKDVTVSAVQDENGNWIPYEVFYKCDYPIQTQFKEHIAKELGITEERQYVNEQNTMDQPIEE